MAADHAQRRGVLLRQVQVLQQEATAVQVRERTPCAMHSHALELMRF